MRPLPLLVSVPHAGLRVPDEVRNLCVLTPAEIAADGDEQAAEIYLGLEAEVVAFATTDVARAIVDVNRPEDDRSPDGVVKTRTCLDAPVYDPFPSEEVVRQLLDRYHRPYHDRLRALARSCGAILGLDCHTMLETGPPMGPLPGRRRPEVCVSNLDGASCPDDVLDVLAGCLGESLDVEVARNFPFRGGHITRAHAAELGWVQLELSRGPFRSVEEKGAGVRRALRRFCERMAA